MTYVRMLLTSHTLGLELVSFYVFVLLLIVNFIAFW